MAKPKKPKKRKPKNALNLPTGKAYRSDTGGTVKVLAPAKPLKKGG